MKNCQCLTEPVIDLPDDMSVAGLYADSWTLAHQQVPQHFFQMHPEDGKRAIALMVDWTKTADRYVEYSLKDMSSNKKFADGKKRKRLEETRKDMADMLAEIKVIKKELKKGQMIEHNEVRTVQIDKSALVGLLWNPILKPTGLSEGRKNWNDTKLDVQKFVVGLKKSGVRVDPFLPIFSYKVESDEMELEHIGHIVPQLSS